MIYKIESISGEYDQYREVLDKFNYKHNEYRTVEFSSLEEFNEFIRLLDVSIIVHSYNEEILTIMIYDDYIE
ncbi:hypothetical protein QU593_10040 [Rossellomorea marisflavi]|uniref:hypothetical protein n=1 Tax=Rossellomorea marisflavi TaxID=189381 RepID=UPI0025B04E60|nr:hypothetical protein [Rossellomorea marisflavi]WJV20744.1 hypothetical protein QU593_10040 [Rossellomorea marisflavi]